MSNVSQIYGTLRDSSSYIILKSMETEVSGNLSILQNLDVCGNITFNNTDLSTALSNLDLTRGQDASFNNVDITNELNAHKIIGTNYYVNSRPILSATAQATFTDLELKDSNTNVLNLLASGNTGDMSMNGILNVSNINHASGVNIEGVTLQDNNVTMNGNLMLNNTDVSGKLTQIDASLVDLANINLTLQQDASFDNVDITGHLNVLGDISGNRIKINNTNNIIAIGNTAGSIDQEENSVAIGYHAGQSRQESFSLAIGNMAGFQDQSANSVAIGFEAGKTNQSTTSVAIGNEAGQTNQNECSVAIGDMAGRYRQESFSVALGWLAGNTDQSAFSVAIGREAAKNNQSDNSIAIGSQAGMTSQSTTSIAIGSHAGQTDQEESSVAIGNEAGKTSQHERSVAIGNEAGNTSQHELSVAIGQAAGKLHQGMASLAIGNLAGQTNQSANSVAIGSEAGYYYQGEGSVAIGMEAGNTDQGVNSVAIGNRAGYSNQTNNSIIINATDNNLNNTEADSFVVKPIRESSGNQVLLYDDSTGEITRNNDVSLNDININGTIKLQNITGNSGDILMSQGPNNQAIWISPPIGPVGPVGPAGPQGADGAAGADGADGANGADGAAGPQGPAGPAGADGAAGPAGPVGEQGPAGADGADGQQGIQGEQGPAGATGPVGPALSSIYAQLSPVNPSGNQSSDISLNVNQTTSRETDILFRTDISLSSYITANDSSNITIEISGVYLINATITVKKNNQAKPKLVKAKLYKSNNNLIGGAEWEEENSSGEATVNIHFSCIHKTTSNNENINLKLTVQSYGGNDDHLILSQEYTKITIVKIA